MPDWRRVIVGDAFCVPSHDFNYYRDLFLFWPFLLFTIASLVILFSGSHDRRPGLMLAALSLSSIVLARERFLLIGAALGFCAAQGMLSFGLKHDWVGLALAIPAGTLFLVLIRFLKDHKLSYRYPRRGPFIADILVGLSSLGFSILVLRWIVR